MNTAQIQIGELYALNIEGQRTVRFSVEMITTVTTRTKRKDKGETRNIITGVVEESDLPGEPIEVRRRKVSPSDLVGHYLEFAELKAKQEEDSRIAKEVQAKKDANRLALWKRLYAIAGITPPEEPQKDSYEHPFRYGFNDVEITERGIELLVVAFGIRT